jgi:hypothetical protein
MSWDGSPPTVSQFQTFFFRDFQYAPDRDPSLKYVQPQDIQNAIKEALIDFNWGLFGDNGLILFWYLAAHCMVENIRNSSMGLNSQAKFPNENASVGGVSISNSIVAKFADEPNFARFLTTGYGKKYLTLAYPYTVGAGIGIVPGTITNG